MEWWHSAGWGIVFLAAGVLPPIFLIWSVKKDSKLKWAFPYFILVFILLFSIIVATASPHAENLWAVILVCVLLVLSVCSVIFTAHRRKEHSAKIALYAIITLWWMYVIGLMSLVFVTHANL